MTVAAFLAACDGKWSRVAGASPSAIATMVGQSGLALPADYLEFLRLCNGGDGFLDVLPCYLRIWPAEEVVGSNRDYQMPEYVPGFFGFGTSGGGEFFAFDTRGLQPWPVVSIPFIPMEAQLASASFSELLGHVVLPEVQDA
jgi:hypothetical protein